MRPASHLIASSAENGTRENGPAKLLCAMQDEEEAMSFFGGEEGDADQSQG
jgi:hypothetical protein